MNNLQKLAFFPKKLVRFLRKSRAEKWGAIKWWAWGALSESYRRRRIFRDVYRRHQWGSDAGSPFFSGVGSRGQSADVYVNGMAHLLERHAAKLGRALTVVDLGCGDFEVGAALVARIPDLTYIGCDIVPELIAHHIKTYANERISFQQLDIVADPLPDGDVCLVRQVLQHLSNGEILDFLRRANYDYLYVTEGHPAIRIGPFNPDKRTGCDVRFDWAKGRGRGVELDQPPYCLETTEVFRACERANEIIITERVHLKSQISKSATRLHFPMQSGGTNSIPRYIFQTWKSKADIPPTFTHWMRSFDIMNPGFRHILWDDDDNRQFIASYYEWFLPIYDSYPREIYRADAVRYFFLYTFGGIYSDMDSECLKPLENLLCRADVLLGRMGSNVDYPHSIPNATMASRPRQEFWLVVIWNLVIAATRTRWLGPEEVTGPVLLKSSFDLYVSKDTIAKSRVTTAVGQIVGLLPPDLYPIPRRSNVHIFPNREWFALDWTDPIHLRLRQEIFEKQLLDEDSKKTLFPDSSIISYWASSWTPGDLTQ